MKNGDVIKIGPYDYELSFEEHLRDGEGNELYGHINYQEEKIEILSETTVNRKQNAFLHEIIHGIEETYCLDLIEEDVDILATTLIQVFKDNGMLVEEKWKMKD